MLHRQSLSKLHFNESQVSISSYPQCREEQIHGMPDVEMGLPLPCNQVVDVSLNNIEDLVNTGQCDDAGRDFTHVMIPCPGQGIGLSPILPPKSSKIEKQSSRRGIFVRKKDKEEVEHTSTNNNSNAGDQQEKRDVPVHCAICLMEYDISERVCWASNPECTHVFHEDCILNWLIYLGRIKSKMPRYLENLTDEQLLKYKLECPCCRQDFIWKEALAEVHGSERD
jgi:hypothetical protein